MFSKTVFKVAIVAVCLISFHGVLGMPDLSLVDDFSVDNSTLHRSRRGGAGQDLAETVALLDQWSDQVKDRWSTEISRCRKFGCHNGYCWSYCTAALEGKDNEWCYTTKGKSQDRDYVSCSQDSECNGCWKCAGPCALI